MSSAEEKVTDIPQLISPENNGASGSCTNASCNNSNLNGKSGSPISPSCRRDPKTIIGLIEKSIEQARPCFSFEFFPPKTAVGVDNLYTRIERLSLLEPAFMDITWGAGGSTADLTLEISSVAQSTTNSEVMMHLTCTNMPVDKVKEGLNRAREAGIRNIMALRGDPPHGAETWEKCDGGLSYAIDLVKLIRQEHGDWFGISVAGYPEGHLESESVDQDIQHLKAKVDAGADFIVTQLFYDVDLFLNWVKKCRDVGITVPIIPGIMPIQSYAGFQRMTGFCKTFVPQEILDELALIQNDEAAVKDYGVELGTKMCRKLLAAGVPGLHFYTLNLERSCVSILENLGFISPVQAGGLPWKQSQVVRRHRNETVRPIFWANRPRSYIQRTSTWDEFPNGRWGNSASPAFGDLTDHHLYPHRAGKVEERRSLWGESPSKPIDIFGVFSSYINGNVGRLPWCEEPLQLESQPIKDALKRINQAGFLTINSQPRVNGAPSEDQAVGWGGPGGYVYQKAYLEFFCSPSNLELFAKAAQEIPGVTFTAFNAKGEKHSNRIDVGRADDDTVTAVTWGVFPNREIIQPTVVDTRSFAAWKDEAFALWITLWKSIYSPESESSQLIQEIHDSYFLVNVVDNNFVSGDIFAVFDKFLG